MYVPKHFEETRVEVLHDMIRTHPLGTLVTLGASELLVNHIPFIISAVPSPFGTLRGHVARVNPVWREFSDRIESIAIFQGPQSYVSPSWYPSKRKHGKVVPTWNYVVVHAYGWPKIIEDAEWLVRHLSELTTQHEASQALPWKVTDAPKDFTDKLIGAIVGIEIPITRMDGKWKATQNRPLPDRHGVVEGLASQHDTDSTAMAEIVRRTLDR